MCGKMAFSDKHDNNKKEIEQQQEQIEASNMIIEEIDNRSVAQEFIVQQPQLMIRVKAV
jgi:hypothetical protein